MRYLHLPNPNEIVWVDDLANSGVIRATDEAQWLAFQEWLAAGGVTTAFGTDFTVDAQATPVAYPSD